MDFLAAVTEATELAGKDLKANVSAVHSEVVRDLEEAQPRQFAEA